MLRKSTILLATLALASVWIAGCNQTTPETAGSFTLSLEIEEASAPQGGSAELTLTLTPEYKFTGTVDLSVEDEAGTTYPDTFFRTSPAQLSLQGVPMEAAVSIEVGSAVPAGVYHLYLAASASGVHSRSAFTLEVTPTASAWTALSTPLYSVTYGDRLVAVGDSGTIRYSDDGVSWSTPGILPEGYADLRDAAYGNGLYVAVGEGGTVLTSSDGETWMKQSLPSDAALWGVTFGNGLFVAVGSATDSGPVLFTSTDGSNWTEPTLTLDTASTILRSVTYGTVTLDGAEVGMFVAAGDGDLVLTSVDGQTWTQQNPGTSGKNFYAAGFALGKFWIGGGSYGVLLSSPDGVTWTEVNWADSSGSSVYSSTTLNAIVEGDGKIVISDRGNRLILSEDGVNWTAIPAPITYPQGMTFGGGVYTIVGELGQIATSTDALDWTIQAAYPGGYPVYYRISFVNGKFYQYARTNTFLVSDDGVNWTQQPIEGDTPFTWPRRLVYLNDRYILVGDDDMVLVSFDGKSWSLTSIDPEYPPDVWNMAYGQGTYTDGVYVAATRSALYASKDLVSWTRVTDWTAFYDVLFADDHFVAIGGDGAYTSPDGLFWTQHDMGTVSTPRYLINAGGTLVAATDWGEIVYSEDGGVTWQPAVGITPYENNYTFLAYAENGPVVAVTYAGTILRSFDHGVTWEPVLEPPADHPDMQYYFASYGNGRFVILGNSTLLTSP